MSIGNNFSSYGFNDSKSQAPAIVIVEQPKQRGLRFRYKCEGRSAGSIPGENTSADRKTYPSIKIINYDGPSVIVVVSCVSKDKPYVPHPHNLVGQDCENGVCTIKVKSLHSEISFPNIGIQCCKRHDVEENLKVREKLRVDPFSTGYPSSSNHIDLNSVRLCFQAFLPDHNKKFTRVVPPEVSNPIIDKKSVHDLVICRLSRQSGCVLGGDEVFLLCEKINKDDIKVRFYQELDNNEIWEAEGEFSPTDVHRQYAIVFRTPAYRDVDISENTTVFIQLRRLSDDAYGDPKPFQYVPQDPDPDGLMEKKRKRVLPVGSQFEAPPIPFNVASHIPCMVMDVSNKEEGEQDDELNGRSFVKNKLKQKIENKIPDLPQQLTPIFHNVTEISSQSYSSDQIINNRTPQNAKIINFYNAQNNEIKSYATTTAHLNNTHNNIMNKSLTKSILNGSNIFNSNNCNRIEVAANEIICSPTTTNNI